MLRYSNKKYILVDEGDHFGDLDIVLENEMQMLKENEQD
jgi:hypothetical protein